MKGGGYAVAGRPLPPFGRATDLDSHASEWRGTFATWLRRRSLPEQVVATLWPGIAAGD
jgi:hypothetical protein